MTIAPPGTMEVRHSSDEDRLPTITRPTRRLATLLAALGVVGITALLTWTVTRNAKPCQDLGDVKSFRGDTVSFVSCVPAFVVRTAPEPVVFLARTPHLAGEPLRWDAQRRVFFSPLHGERFDVSGHLLSGPALRDLWRCPVAVRDGELWIVVPDGTRSENVKRACSL